MSNQIDRAVFLAIVPTEEVRFHIRDLNRKLKQFSRNFNFVPPEYLHITLQFLSYSLSQEELLYIAEELNNIYRKHNRFNLTLDKLNFGYQSQHVSKLLFFNIKEQEELRIFTHELHRSVQALGLDNLKKRKDHLKLINKLTIARIKSSGNRSFTREVREFISRLDYKPINFEVSEIKIIDSIIRNNSYTYSILHSIRFRE